MSEGHARHRQNWAAADVGAAAEGYMHTHAPAARKLATLSDGKVGNEGVIAGLLTHERAELRKLMALGVLPGTPIRLLRRFPAFVFQLGYSQFAIDHALAKKIHIAWDE